MQQLSVLASYGKCALHHAGTDQPPYMPVLDRHYTSYVKNMGRKDCIQLV
jgi:hypothetical protein